MRTKETAEMFSDMMGCPVIYEERLREINFGEYNGKSCKRATDFFRKESRDDFQSFLELGYYLEKRDFDKLKIALEKQWLRLDQLILPYQLELKKEMLFLLI